MDKIQEKLTKLGWDIEQLLCHLDTVIRRQAKDRERHKQYFEKNKKKLYKYHEDWRKKHPEYREKKRIRERNKKR